MIYHKLNKATIQTAREMRDAFRVCMPTGCESVCMYRKDIFGVNKLGYGYLSKHSALISVATKQIFPKRESYITSYNAIKLLVRIRTSTAFLRRDKR